MMWQRAGKRQAVLFVRRVRKASVGAPGGRRVTRARLEPRPSIATYFGVRVTHSALVDASVRLAHRGQATYAVLVEHVRSSPVVHTDDTGWRIDTDSAWLWVFATAEVTVYVIARSRGSDVVVSTLGEDLPAG